MASEYFYGGKSYTNDPVYSNVFSGYNTSVRTPFSHLSSATDQRTANQIKDVSENLNTGIKNIEAGSVDPGVFESIPKEHFKELRRLTKLAGAEMTFHAPMIDPTGITDHGWDKTVQKGAEEQLWDSIKKSQELNPKGTVVTFHATSVGLPAAEVMFKEGLDKEKAKEGILVSQAKPKSMIFINPSDGKISQIKEEDRYFDSAGSNKKVEFNPDKELERLNEDQWMQKVNNLTFYAERGTQAVDVGLKNLQTIKAIEEGKKIIDKEYGSEEEKQAELSSDKKKAERELNYGKVFLRDTYRNFRELYDEAYKSLEVQDKEKLKLLQTFASEIKPLVAKYDDLSPKELEKFSEKIEQGVQILGKVKPKLFVPIKQFAIDKAAETTANLAWRGYKEFEEKGKAAPIIALENHPAQASLLTTGEDLKKVIEQSRKNFVEKAVKEGLSERDAKKEAEKLIGATWDVGHINMLRRYGFEKQDILKETEAVAPFVKKVHLSDNFGFEHTELPMGMGNVPMGEIINRLKKGQEGFDNVKQVIEAGNWWQHFSPGGKNSPPIVPTLQGMGTPLYGSGGPAGGWNQLYGTPGGYFGGYGTMLPENNFNIYGAGFSSLPTELGGQIASKDSRMSGTPMA